MTRSLEEEFQRWLGERREAYRADLEAELPRLVGALKAIGVQRIVLFGSMAQGKAGLGSDLDLLVIWDTPLGFMERTIELYRRLQPRVAVDLFVYTPEEMARMADRPLIRRALMEGKVLYEA